MLDFNQLKQKHRNGKEKKKRALTMTTSPL